MSKFSEYLPKIRKALIAGAGAGFAAYTAAQAKGPLSLSDWEFVVGSTIVVFGVTWFIPNETDNPASGPNGPTVTKS